jgi:hypothetical protein
VAQEYANLRGPAGEIDTVVRFHDPRRMSELQRCIFSLVGQTYRPLRIVLAVQRFSEPEIAAVSRAITPLFDHDETISLAIVPWNDPYPRDGRSALLNVGVANARGRYLAFLDYDDVLYPEAYELLVGRLEQSGAAIAFASVRTRRLAVYEGFCREGEDVDPPFSGLGLADLFRNNFCPLHSYVIDRARVSPDLLSYVPTLTMEEDYDVLLRICATFPSDFALLGIQVGEYYYKEDASNSVAARAGLVGEALRHYREEISVAIEQRRRSTLVAPNVQRTLGLAQVIEPRTVRQTLDVLGSYR